MRALFLKLHFIVTLLKTVIYKMEPLFSDTGGALTLVIGKMRI
jgi:hypothetical protein